MKRKAIVTDETPRDAELVHESQLLDRFRSFQGQLLFIFGGNDPDTKFAAEAYARFCRQQNIASEFHESQNYILTYEDVRFFDRWGY